MNKKNLVLIICAVVVLLIIIWLIAVKMQDNNTENITISPEATTIEETSAVTSDSSDSANISDYVAKEDMLMHEMMENMMNIEKSGSADIDFLAGMIPHHQSAIEMSESYIDHDPQNADIKSLAQNIISVQQEEISAMTDLSSTIKARAVTDTSKADAYQARKSVV